MSRAYSCYVQVSAQCRRRCFCYWFSCCLFIYLFAQKICKMIVMSLPC